MEEFRSQFKIVQHKEITLQDAILITSASPQGVVSPSQLPDYMLSRIMMLDCASRELPILPNEITNPEHKSVTDILELVSLDEDETENSVNPMDVFLFLFIQCESIFRQTFVTQVSRCQLSLPLITNYPSSQNPTLYVFAFKTLFKDYLRADNLSSSLSVTEEKLPIVSFIRIGNCDNSQKSEMLNKLLGVSGYFFDRNQVGNSKKRLFLNGTVDIAWYLPKTPESGKKALSDIPFVILNLRGDALKFSIQRKFATRVSSLIYVFIEINTCDCRLSDFLNEFHNEYGDKCIYLLYKGNPNPETGKKVEIPEFLRKTCDTVLFLPKKNLGEDSIALAKSVSDRLKKDVVKVSLTDCISIAKRLQIRVDIDVSNFISSQCVVDKIITKMLNFGVLNENEHAHQLANLKLSMLPLQGNNWSKWAEYTRELHSFELKDSTDYNEHKNVTDKKRGEARQNQLDMLLNPTPLMIDILNHCRTYGLPGDFYTLWKLLQNEFNSLSKQHLPPLYEEYRRLHELSISTEFADKTNGEERKKKQKELKESLGRAAKAIAESSFGIEHIFRELGQLFEVYKYNVAHEFTNLAPLEQKLSFQFDKLPDIAASLLIEGHAFEILDGDVNHVPITWVTEVLKSLAFKIGTTKRVFVLSVLGTQSTGKSTLLNTMFGANFPVSSGRCTRGIFMQLIPIEQSLSIELGYNYIILLDTEGLRAPELSINSSYRRDNELATFAVGLGDATIINMSGEGHSDVQDILQIIIFAFIRMKESSYLKPRCMFVHQNVPDYHAHTNLLIARSNLIKTLDKMTECAAQQESKTAFYSKFCDVIDFRPEKEVFYFPGLFEGEPPLNRIAPAYSKKAAKLREYILKSFNSIPGRNFQTISTWSQKMNNLWEAVLCENFVFSYRNALEVTARFELDCQLSSWYSNFIRACGERKSESLNLLFNDEFGELDTTLESLLSELRQEGDTPSIESNSEKELMKYFFMDHDNKDVLIQWETNASLYIQGKREKEMRKIEKEYKMVYKVQKSNKEIDRKFSEFRRDIVSKVRSLFENMELQGRSLTNKHVINSEFKRIWEEWRSQIKVDSIPTRDICKDIQRALSESPIIKSMRVIPNKKYLIMDTSRYVLIGTQDFSYLSHLNSENDPHYYIIHDLIGKKSSSFSIFSIFSPKVHKISGLSQFNTLLDILNTECERHIREYSSSLQNTECPYDPNTFLVVIEICYTLLNNHKLAENNNIQTSLELTVDFHFDFIFYQCCRAIVIFKKIQDIFLDRVNLDRKLEQLKYQLRVYFTSYCQGIETESLCAKELARITMEGLKSYLADKVPTILLQKFRDDINHQSDYHSRASLILRILKDLARNKKFDDYISYITNPTNFIIEHVRSQITQYSKRKIVLEQVKNYVLENVKSLSMLYKEKSLEACLFLHSDYLGTISGILSVTNSIKKLKWESFKKKYYSEIKTKVKHIALDDFDVLDMYSISDYQQFCELYSIELDKLVQNIKWQEWISNILEEDIIIYRSITDSLLDCQALCPFCKELCQLSAGEHEHYCSTFHRPKGVNGWHKISTRMISLDDCASSIKNKGNFIYNDELYEYVDYKTVNEFFNSWKILESDATESKYWQWVIYQFKKKFLEYYDIVDNAGIKYWERFTEKEVISDLENHYKSEIFRHR